MLRSRTDTLLDGLIWAKTSLDWLAANDFSQERKRRRPVKWTVQRPLICRNHSPHFVTLAARRETTTNLSTSLTSTIFFDNKLSPRSCLGTTVRPARAVAYRSVAMPKIEFVLNSILAMPSDEVRTLDREGLLALISTLPTDRQYFFIERLKAKMRIASKFH